MKILITGSRGFIGKNLFAELNNRGYNEIYEYNSDTPEELLEIYTSDCDFVYHLAGVNRPQIDNEYIEGNINLTAKLLALLKKNRNSSPILITSSIQANLDNPYGRSKKTAENLLYDYSRTSGAKVLIYRLPNVFGKWCRPNYNSVVSTYCYNISRDLDISITDPMKELTLCYIDDVVEEFLNALDNNETKDTEFCLVPITYKIKLGELAHRLYEFKDNRDTLIIPSLENKLDKALYATYLSYLDNQNFSYKLKKNADNRGWLTEFIKSESTGQIFISKTNPGVTRGNHWHHTKVEKFFVIQGSAIVKFRKFNTNEIIEYEVSGENPEVVDIPAGYIHSITNNGSGELLTLFWASEIFDKNNSDTYGENV
ncbi:NAD-dependent epimerase/dehydratase family protein [Cytobacillus firmus]|uniref:polysaccharide biosynthesis C-terminal domain-containing protein n=1 Tax=Cytobacillus firmus TaxID=1399 RepID=UPI003B9E9338